MARDDWKYDEEMGEHDEEEPALPKEKICAHCLHAIPVEAPYCTWCGREFPEPRKPRVEKE